MLRPRKPFLFMSLSVMNRAPAFVAAAGFFALVVVWSFDRATVRRYYLEIAVAFGVVGVLLILWGINRFFNYLDARNHWPTVEGEILSSGLVARQDHRSREERFWKIEDFLYIGRIWYQYEVDGKVYQGDRVFYGKPDIRATRSEGVKAVTRTYESGDRTPVYYNPRNPANAFLLRYVPFGYFSLNYLSGAAMFLVVAYILWSFHGR